MAWFRTPKKVYLDYRLRPLDSRLICSLVIFRIAVCKRHSSHYLIMRLSAIRCSVCIDLFPGPSAGLFSGRTQSGLHRSALRVGSASTAAFLGVAAQAVLWRRLRYLNMPNSIAAFIVQK
jgi:hypothetical protein